MHVWNYQTRNFATLGPSELRPPFTGLSVRSANNCYVNNNSLDLLLSSSSTGQVSDPIHHVNISQSPVFLINSRHPLFCVALFTVVRRALLFPKLQSQFAEFLQDGYLYALVKYTCSPVLVVVRCFFYFCITKIVLRWSFFLWRHSVLDYYPIQSLY